MSDVSMDLQREIGDRLLGYRYVIITTPVTIQRVFDLCFIYTRLRIDIRKLSLNIELTIFNFSIKIGIGEYHG